MRRVILGAMIAVLGVASPALAQSEKNASDASAQTSIAVGAIGESGLKATAGVVGVPLAAAGSAAAVTGVGLSAAGLPTSGGALATVGSGTAQAGIDLVEFSGKPLTITKDVVVGPAPQPAPKVPYAPATKPPEPKAGGAQ